MDFIKLELEKNSQLTIWDTAPATICPEKFRGLMRGMVRSGACVLNRSQNSRCQKSGSDLATPLISAAWKPCLTLFPPLPLISSHCKWHLEDMGGPELGNVGYYETRVITDGIATIVTGNPVLNQSKQSASSTTMFHLRKTFKTLQRAQLREYRPRAARTSEHPTLTVMRTLSASASRGFTSC
jgi:hypothetical protein